MFDRTDELLIIADGDLPSLVALAAARVAAKGWPSQGVEGLPPAAPAVVAIAPTQDDRVRAIQEQARVLGMPTIDLSPAECAGADWLAETALLLAACAAAAAAKRPTVVWPIQYESGDQINLDRVSKAVDRSIACARLVEIDSGLHGCHDLHIDTPLVDYTDRQIAELAVDLSVPVHLCWWWTGGGGDGDRLRQRWMAVLGEAGFRTPQST